MTAILNRAGQERELYTPRRGVSSEEIRMSMADHALRMTQSVSDARHVLSVLEPGQITDAQWKALSRALANAHELMRLCAYLDVEGR